MELPEVVNLLPLGKSIFRKRVENLRAELRLLVKHPSEIHEVFAGRKNNGKSVHGVEALNPTETLKTRYICMYV